VTVSVVMAVRNGGPYLAYAVESVLAQTYANFELLMIDDASTDGALETLPSDPRIRVIRNERNLGQVPSLNRGLAEAHGGYVARLDADDTMLPTRLERQVDVLDGNPSVVLVGTWMDVVDERGRLYAKLRGQIRDFPQLILAILTDRYPFGHPSLMFRRDVVRALGGYDASLAPSEDKDLYRRLALARHQVRCVEEALVRYRRHERQLSQERRTVQLAHDHEGQERFLAELAGPQAARALRILLAAGSGDAALLNTLLEGAATRLRLDDQERAAVTRGLARHLAGRALRAGPKGREAVRWAAKHEPLAIGLMPLLPLSPVVRAAGVRVRAATHAFPRLRQIARRVRLLRWIYARLG
jgi:GT2 family glycosyltransferase